MGLPCVCVTFARCVIFQRWISFRLVPQREKEFVVQKTNGRESRENRRGAQSINKVPAMNNTTASVRADSLSLSPSLYTQMAFSIRFERLIYKNQKRKIEKVAK